MQTEQVNVGGRWFTLYYQDWGQDCGPTCVAMCIKRLRGVGVDIDALRKQTNRPMVSPGIQAKIDAMGLTSRDFGTFTTDLSALANRNGLRGTNRVLNSMGMLDAFRAVSHNKMYIAHIEWTGGGGHFVVVAGVTETGNPIILDPYFGAQVANLCPHYNVNDGGHSVTARFSGHVIEVTT